MSRPVRLARPVCGGLAFALMLALGPDPLAPRPDDPLRLVAAALADDDDGGDDDGDDGDDDGGGFSGGGFSGGDDDDDDRGSSGGGSGRFLSDDDDDDDDRPARRRQPARRGAAPPPPPPPLTAVPGELVGADIDEVQIAALEGAGWTVIERDDLDGLGGNVTRLSFPGALSLEEARTALLAVAPQALVDANHLYRPERGQAACSGDDCLARALIAWQPPAPGAPACAGGLTLGMIDTAVNADHPSLKDARIEVLRLGDAKLPESGRQHGTAVASLFVGSADSRSPGLLPGASLVAVDIFTAGRRGGDSADTFSLVRGLDHLVSRNVDVVNLSLSGPANAVLERGVQRAVAADTLLVAAAGNEGPRAQPVYPAAYPDVLTVTAVDRNKRPYRRAGQGAHVDLAAPGVGVWTAASVSGARVKTGTSFAAPFVSAAALLSRAAAPGRTASEIAAALTAGAEDLGAPGHDAVFGWGLLRPPACAAPRPASLPEAATSTLPTP